MPQKIGEQSLNGNSGYGVDFWIGAQLLIPRAASTVFLSRRLKSVMYVLPVIRRHVATVINTVWLFWLPQK